MTLLARNSSVGKLYRGSGGKLCRGCCTPNIGEYCSACGLEGVTPEHIYISFQNVDIASGCYNPPSGRDLLWSGVPNINSVYKLFQDQNDVFPGVCIWSYLLDVDIVITFYNSTDGSCSGGVYSTDNADQMIIYASYTGSYPNVHWTVGVYFLYAGEILVTSKWLPWEGTIIVSDYPSVCCEHSELDYYWTGTSENEFAHIGGTADTFIDFDCDLIPLWQTDISYATGSIVRHITPTAQCFICTDNHVSDSSNEPAVGTNYTDYWTYYTG